MINVDLFEKTIGYISVGVICIFAFLGFYHTFIEYDYTRPVGEITKVDSLVKANDSIKIVVNNLDSIKHAKVIEVQALDNDSTVKLFYNLINK